MRFFAIMFMVLFIASCGDSPKKKDKIQNKKLVDNNQIKKTEKEIIKIKDFNKILKGKIDNSIEIFANLKKKDSVISGSYYYKNHNKTIQLKGNIIGSKLTISETNVNGKTTGTWKVELMNDTIFQGEWISVDNSRKLNLTLEASSNKQEFKEYKLDKKYQLRKDKSSPSYKISLQYLLPKNNKEFKKEIDKSFFEEKIKSQDVQANLEKHYNHLCIEYKRDGVGYPRDWSYSISMGIKFNDKNLVCYDISKGGFTVGAHGFGYSSYFLFDLISNKRITKNDIFKEETEDKLLVKIIEKIALLNGVKGNQGLAEKGYWDIKISDNIYITNSGIGFFYNTYDIACYVAGYTDLFIPFSEIKEFIEPASPIMRIVK